MTGRIAGAPPAGTIGVVSTTDASRWFDRLTSEVIQFDTESPVNHAFVYLGQGHILEARPGGAGWNSWDAYPGTIWLTGIAPPARTAAEMRALADTLTGTPYNWLDLLAIGIAQNRWSPEMAERWDHGHAPWWAARVSEDGRLICSQLCDLFYQRLGVQLYDDGRLSGLVSPGDLYHLGVSSPPPLAWAQAA